MLEERLSPAGPRLGLSCSSGSLIVGNDKDFRHGDERRVHRSAGEPHDREMKQNCRAPWYTSGMGYRTVEIRWMPAGHAQWATSTAARKEAARLWADMVERHHRIRRLNWRWPSKARWQEWAKGRYPGLSAQAVQQIIGEFCEAVNATRQL